MANTYVAISTVTVGGGGSANITFSAIPSTYTDLLIKVSARGTTATKYDYLFMQLNGATTNYSGRVLYADNASVGSTTNSSASNLNPGLVNMTTSTASTFASTDIYIPNYAGSNYKSISGDATSEDNSTYAAIYLMAQLWSNTAAITSIVFTTPSGSFAQYSTATLYGIKNS